MLAGLAVHELSHLVFSSLLGYRISELRATLFGGRLKIDPLMEINPEAELVIAASGPVANFLMAAGVLYLRVLGISNYYLDCWQQLNILIGTANLLPAFPLDGGRILHAWLSKKLGIKASISLAKAVARLIALLLSGLGISIFSNRNGILLMITGLFIFVNTFKIKPPELNLSWKLLQHKKKLLQSGGMLNLRTVMVRPETFLRNALQRYGSTDYLLFFLLDQQQKLTIISEEFAWNTLVDKGFYATFQETMKIND